MLTDLLSKVGGVLQRRKVERDQTYSSFVMEAADGKKIDAEELADMLEAVGRTVPQFAEDVQLVTDRRQWKAQLDMRKYWDDENERIEKARADAQQKFNDDVAALRSAWAKKADELREKDWEIQRQRALCDAARVKLMETSGRNREIAALSMQRGEPIREIEGDLGRRKRSAEARISAAKAALKREPMPGSGFVSKADAIARELRSAEEELAFVNAQIARAEQESAKAGERLQQVEAEALAVA